METMSLNEILQYRKSYDIVPVAATLYADTCTPVEALCRLRGESKRCCLLESMEDATRWGRYTFIGVAPSMEMRCKDGVIQIKDAGGGTEMREDPVAVLQTVLQHYRAPRLANLPPFTGGFTGYFSYDYVACSERSLQLHGEDEGGFADFELMLFDKVVAFDHWRQQIVLIVNVRLDEAEKNYSQALRELADMARALRCGRSVYPAPLRLQTSFQPLFTKDEYCAMVRRGKHYIKEGEIFQVVLSNRVKARAKGSLFDAYRVLRTLNPSPYLFYLCSETVEIAGSSPETLIRLTDGALSTFPLAGTRRRGRTSREDEALAAELVRDPKELAEHNMLVDLGRNDLGRISKFGTVHVETYLDILRFSHVMHLGSTVTGEIGDGKTAIDAIGAVLPAGTLSGAPKIRACQIIDELEDCKRGIYGGAVGYIDFTGNMDMAIAIRLAYKKDDIVYVRAGAGIVADSRPEAEYQECVHKAQAIVTALETANGGIDR
ncbi:anthranilate synthase component I [Megasphaera vaginalis (ex Srinivasan et al. 2021)]|uniref:Anthranilate synthase component 1 n=1 Tax=Megasphaera vaginalis (ex Srinivasan et al. 2021) TaxID=1111454 RepID=U7UST9_9FIRM|nr:anthranilate synthase component I [Megasphaera vaginalis (ex Srinivasan et al. 2021)]ERT62507.1 anthranilate synthase component I [Megasphaera vaginalis (ex Srinivasan et al. 2021)]